MSNKTKHFFLLAGEPSGDLHGAELINCLKKTTPSAVFSGIGGTKMQKTGLASLAPINQLAVMGFWEVIKKFNFFIALEKLVLKHIKKTKPDTVVLIDYPGFNLRIAKKIKELYNIPIIYYISPQVWAWKEKRIIHIKKNIDELIVIFPFEVKWFKKRDITVQYFGHPLIDQWKKCSFVKKTSHRHISYNDGKIIRHARTITIGLFPGSRKQEIQKHLPLFLDLIKRCDRMRKGIIWTRKLLEEGGCIDYPPRHFDPKNTWSESRKNQDWLENNVEHIKFVISKSKDLPSDLFKDCKGAHVSVVSSPLFDILDGCDLAVVASGTASLECAVSQTPFITIYKTSLLSWLITQTIIKLKFASIVNILANKKIVPELLQGNFTEDNVIKSLRLLSDPDSSQIMKKNFEAQKALIDVVNTLGDGSSYQKAANYIAGIK